MRARTVVQRLYSAKGSARLRFEGGHDSAKTLNDLGRPAIIESLKTL